MYVVAYVIRGFPLDYITFESLLACWVSLLIVIPLVVGSNKGSYMGVYILELLHTKI